MSWNTEQEVWEDCMATFLDARPRVDGTLPAALIVVPATKEDKGFRLNPKTCYALWVGGQSETFQADVIRSLASGEVRHPEKHDARPQTSDTFARLAIFSALIAAFCIGIVCGIGLGLVR